MNKFPHKKKHLSLGVFSYVEMSEQTALLACGNRKAFPYFDINQNGKALGYVIADEPMRELKDFSLSSDQLDGKIPATVGRDSCHPPLTFLYKYIKINTNF
jgi:hypothetical protein